jgi:hypothetical protein
MWFEGFTSQPFRVIGGSVQTPPARNPVEMAVTPFDHGVAAMERQLLAMGVPVEFLARVLMNHAASIVSLIEPAAVRAEAMKGLISNFPQAVRRAQLAAATTPGGVILPGKRADALAEADAPGA